MPSEHVTVEVETAQPYTVHIGHGLLGEVAAALGSSVQRVALLYDASLAQSVEPLLQQLVESHDVLGLGLPPGEQAKSIEVAAACWDGLGEKGFTRSDAVVTFGGGATTDLGGFVAATWLRGVKVVHVPTTVLGMVDAAVGGKTGIDTTAGKNLVGSFHEPVSVICDIDLLQTLPRRELASGLAESIKCGFIADSRILDLVQESDFAALTWESPVLAEIIERSIRVKAEVVASDLKETGGADGHPGREVLNYGHTLAHAIEKHEEYQIRHGEAVAIGCVYAAELAHRTGLIDADLLARHRAVLGKVGLPVSYQGASFDELLPAIKVDKKSRGNTVRFLVLHGLGQPRILEGPPEELLREAYAALGGTS